MSVFSEKKFWSLALPEPNSGCWIWLGCVGSRGYGAVTRQWVQWKAHRLSFELVRGPFDHALSVLHKCDTPLCVNPDHLFLGTAADNMADMKAKGRGAIGLRNGCYTTPGYKMPWCPPERKARGEKHGNAKLTDDLVRAIRAEVAAGMSKRSVAQRYGISRPVVTGIVERTSWMHVS